MLLYKLTMTNCRKSVIFHFTNIVYGALDDPLTDINSQISYDDECDPTFILYLCHTVEYCIIYKS